MFSSPTSFSARRLCHSVVSMQRAHRPSLLDLPTVMFRRARSSRALRRSTALPSDFEHVVSVYAVHVAQTLHLEQIQKRSPLFGNNNNIQTFKNSILVQLSPSQYSSHHNLRDLPQYAAIYRFGSIVYFNVPEIHRLELTKALQQQHSERPMSRMRSENFDVVLMGDKIDGVADHLTLPDTDESASVPSTASMVTGDYCLVRDLDVNGVAVISDIMAQTVALDSYSDIVDGLLSNFASINTTVTETGSFSSTDKSFLFKTVAQNNSLFIDMISKIGIKDRPVTAWNMTEYEAIHYGLKEEFEIEDRFQNIEFKLNLIQKNAKFFLEVLHHQKSNNLEWIIVVLILLECILMVVEMSGTGEAFFQSWLGSTALLPSSVLKQLFSNTDDNADNDESHDTATEEGKTLDKDDKLQGSVRVL